MNPENNNSNPLSFSGPEAVNHLKSSLMPYFDKANLNPYITKEWKQGIFDLFGVEIINPPDLEKQNYVLLSNHLSDFDGVILGLLHPQIKIIAKIGWTSNKELMEFLELHYHFSGVYRDFEIDKLYGEEKKAALEHNIAINRDSFKHLKIKESSENHARHLLIFPQGTISDINKNSKERINPSFARIAAAAKTGIINIFLEYPAAGGKTRIVCGDPYVIADRGIDYRQIWLDDIISLQNKLDNVRTPVLSAKHSNNNNPNELFF